MNDKDDRLEVSSQYERESADTGVGMYLRYTVDQISYIVHWNDIQRMPLLGLLGCAS